MAGYKFLEGIATADVAFEANGKDLNELFQNAAMAVFATQVDVKTVNERVTTELELQNEDIGQLLVDFLNQIIFYKDANQLIYKSAKVVIIKNKHYALHAELHGEEIDQKKHKLGNDVKAVTMHKFKVEQTKSGWMCRVVLDI
jgi:SHS2 domain-containing protein